MVREFTLQNRTSLKSVTFGQGYDYDFVYTEDDLDWGAAGAQHNTYTYPGQVGVSISNSSIKERDISIVGYAFYSPNEDDFVENGTHESINKLIYEKIREKKNLLDEIINPLDTIRIIIGDYYIEGKPSQSLLFGNTFRENNDYFCKFKISLYCNDPTFKKIAVNIVTISETIPLFRFPLILSNTVPTVMGHRVGFNTVIIENEGNMKIGGKVILSAKGEVVKPMIENKVTGEKMKINKTMEAGERIEITTIDGSNKGIKGFINGVEYNYFKYWDFDNNWMKFPAGFTTIDYSTENGMESLLDVSIELNPQKLSLEDM